MDQVYLLSTPFIIKSYFLVCCPPFLPLPDCQVVGTALLLFAISAINNPANSAISSRWRQPYSLLSQDNFDSGVICVLRQISHLFTWFELLRQKGFCQHHHHLFATLFSTIFPSALALSWSDWSSSTLASALDIMQGEHSVFLCFEIQ